MVDNFESFQSVRIRSSRSEPYLSKQDRPEKEGKKHLRCKCHLKEYCMPFPRLEKAVLILPVHEVLWRLLRGEEAEEQSQPRAPQAPVCQIARLVKQATVVDARYDDFNSNS